MPPDDPERRLITVGSMRICRFKKPGTLLRMLADGTAVVDGCLGWIVYRLELSPKPLPADETDAE
jgi:hypothetical protein